MQIEIGALADPISQQIRAANMKQVGKPVEILDRLNSAVTLAHLHGCLTDAECERARSRLVKMIRVQPNV